jgi:two-component system, sensor histidine kinase
MALLVGALEKKNRLRLQDLEKKTKELQESEMRLQRAEFVAETGNWEVDIATGALYTSEGARRIYGIDKSYATLQQVQKIPLPQYRKRLDNILQSLINNDHPYDVEFKIARPSDNAVIDIRSRATYNSTTKTIFGTIQDITKQKQTEAELVEAKKTSEQANQAKSEFLANMSHEIRTPLNGVLGMLQALDATEPSDEQQRFVRAAIGASRNLSQLLNDILDLSRIETGRMRISETEFELDSLTGSIEDTFRFAAQDKGLALRIVIAGTVPRTVAGDEVRTRQILFNLIGNAIKFTEYGEISLCIDTVGSGADSVRLLFSIADTGIGIPEALMADLCTPFTPASRRSDDKYHGVGLGLSIVKKLTSLMHGEVTIESQENSGTTIYVALPFHRPKIRDISSSAPGDSGTDCCNNLKILLVDDDSISAMACKYLLERMHNTVATASNGLEAIAMVRNQAFDLILMDIQMPVCDGLQATQTIRDRQAFGDKADTPIIAMTAFAMPEEQARFLAAGMDACLAKPVEKVHLLASIALALKNKRSRLPISS